MNLSVNHKKYLIKCSIKQSEYKINEEELIKIRELYELYFKVEEPQSLSMWSDFLYFNPLKYVTRRDYYEYNQKCSLIQNQEF